VKTLYPVQRLAVDHQAEVLHWYRSVLNASDTGTGKTLMSVELARTVGIRPLVVCPKAVISSWQRTFEEQGVDYLGVINYESVRTGNTIYGAWKGAKPKKGKPDRRPFIWSEDVQMIVWDEIHRAKAEASQNARMLKWARADSRYNVLVSATAASNPAEMKAIGYHLGLHEWTNFRMWAKQNGCSLDPWDNLKFTESLERAKNHLIEVRSSIYPARGVKVSRADVAEFFTDTQIISDPLDFGDNGQIDELYAEVETYMAELEAKEALDDPHPAAQALISMLRARQRIELLKVGLIVELAQDAIREGMHVAVFLNFNASVQAVSEKMGGCPVVWGTDPLTQRTQTGSERQQIIDAFQENTEPVIVLNIEAGGVAISLHDEKGGAPRLALISPTWNEKSLHQVLGRVDRAGAKTDTVQRILYAAGSVEEQVRDSMMRKLENLKTLHDCSNLTHTTDNMPPKKKVADDANEPVAVVVPDAEPAHAQYGPSSLKYFEICPSYTNRRDEDSNPAAEQGTRIHHALEVEDPSELHNEEEHHLYEMTLQCARDFEELHEVENGELIREIRLKIDLHHHQTFGTLDRLRIVGRVAVAQDYKFGVNPVDDAEINAQAWAYSLGIFQQFPEVEIIHFYFLIPKQEIVTHAIFTRSEETEPEENWSEDQTVAATYEDMRLRVNLIISRSEEVTNLPAAEREYNPQPHVCEFCGFKERCKALADRALVIAKNLEPGLQLPKDFDPDKLDTPEELGRLRMVAHVLEGWVEVVKKRVNKIHKETALDCDGFKWKTRTVSRSITEPFAAFNLLSEELGIDREKFLPEYFEAVGSVSIEKLEKVLKTNIPSGVDKEDFLEAAMNVLREHEVLTGGDQEIGFFQIDRTKK